MTDGVYDCFLIECYTCGFFWVSSWDKDFCLRCGNGYLHILPLLGDSRESFGYLRDRGFVFLCERMESVIKE